MSSRHNNNYEDRRWSFECKSNLVNRGASTWTPYVNDWDGSMNFFCDDGNVITGKIVVISTVHDMTSDKLSYYN